MNTVSHNLHMRETYQWCPPTSFTVALYVSLTVRSSASQRGCESTPATE